MNDVKAASLHHSASVPLLQDRSLELADFSGIHVEREQCLYHFNDVDKTSKTSRRLAGLFGKSPRELHSDYGNISLHQV
jgi:hypothetical protein